MFEQIIEFSLNHPLLVSAFVILLVLVIFNETRGATTGVTTSEAVRLMNRDEAIAVDIRDRKDFAAGHITGAINIPLANLDKRMDELDKYKDKKVLVVCRMGNSATLAVAKLQKAGYKGALRLKGGMMQWQTDSMPVVKK
ncbi:rhodanese-like domain-containing protein [Marinospirillum alkaliphilum]|uniref:Rhodanese-related sulfurtransferase n=1 Tax=Marinospirillum alkaliphilum DSM 21637 TaxID=1122209 RepID=A0A1K1WRC7_9GAMM|nr:rhodanese-like domain-containing protein [Marinospirillum alkaliphilum]SFX39325.1 Rhodanese-related sulfurtransferase [Marinospirillum alkaliphilum DSM 21637]